MKEETKRVLRDTIELSRATQAACREILFGLRACEAGDTIEAGWPRSDTTEPDQSWFSVDLTSLDGEPTEVDPNRETVDMRAAVSLPRSVINRLSHSEVFEALTGNKPKGTSK